MLRLVIDRSGRDAGFVLADDSAVLCEKIWEGGYAESPAWFDEMAELLRERGCGIDRIEEFVCAVGPGSFSGIRSALAALEGMALPGGRAVCGISSAAALAYEHGAGRSGFVTVVGDARRRSLWLATYRMDADRGLTLFDGSPPTQTAADFAMVAAETLAAAVPPGTLVLSPDFDRIGGLLTELFPRERLITQTLSSRPAVLAAMAADFPALCRPEPHPIYLHPAVAP